ncbi:hypothetical protein WI460_12110 [Gemmatimonadota bacterium Y43]|uniref:hypothetical protein n=1 Tax=Gaopeijia maritima TaxID=3119007 RepID=UPI003293FA58
MEPSPRVVRTGSWRGWTLTLTVVAAVGAGCSSDGPTQAEDPDPESPHVEVNEMFLRTGEGGSLVSATRMIDEVWVPDTVSLVEGDSLQLRIVFLDFSNAEFTLDDATDHSVRAEVEGPATFRAPTGRAPA